MIGILGQTAQLELFDLEANLAPPSNSGGFASPKESLYELLAGQQALVKEGTKTNWYLFDENKKLVAGPVTERDKLLQSDAVTRRAARRASCRRTGRSSASRRRRSSSAAVSARSSARA